MKTKAVRLYGKKDLRLEEFKLPEIKENEILASVITDSICMSTWKLANQGANHKKAPNDLAENPIIIGHEFCGELLEVGGKWAHKYKKGERYVLQANLQLPDRPDCPGYSYPYTGGDATYIVISEDVMNQDCLIPYKGETYFEGSLVEPLSCVIGAFEANYHLKEGSYEHKMGIKPDGNLLIMGGTGPMGLLAIDYALHGPIKPKNLVVTDRDSEKLVRAEKLYPSQNGIEVSYVNVANVEDQVSLLKERIGGGFDDIFVMIPVNSVVSDAAAMLNPDGCLNFFAGPQDKEFSANINFYDVHYSFTHFVGTSGGNTEDMRKAVKLIEDKQVTVANIVTHILGLDAVGETTLNQPAIGGGKKLVYTHKQAQLTKLTEIDTNSDLGRILMKTHGIWNKEAEKYVLENYVNI
ncbi:TPA: zinc-binding dehydrogenase [Enterococcus faecium]|uniref:zinc-binding dehydrogenase n=1 Tax=Enterococcus TaxID=1350 RepID=UPI000CF13EC1|nr:MULTISPECIES: zinc-binding dehydrogenase [Enterococcus]EGP4837151.1 zinc-binding dehydrogenase [Enterococcus faecium]EGP5193004.1 L-sorbose 1-phosphate reductase [Enterococcus faecium]EHM3037084.1 zinc-binding dehydrogenase [Enterococcus faecium]MDQ8223724.1 zinc-binding dehydrogenase [Enterococcus faecium]MEB4773869.1 zinc-binding dehydrogenase [Enterococcus sp. E4-220]